MNIAKTPDPPYFAVIFTSVLRSKDESYETTAKRMVERSSGYPGFLGIDSARTDVGITVCYWKTEEDLLRWKNDTDHLEVQRKGKSTWYKQFSVRIARVERAYNFEAI